MSKDEQVEYSGEISDRLADGAFLVRLSNDEEIVAIWAGKPIDDDRYLSIGGRVLVEMTPYDLGRGRIVLRLKA